MSELSEFVLNFYRAQGALVEPPRYGVHEVLLPDKLAARLGVPALQEIVFDELDPGTGDGRLYLTRGHPLIDRLVEEARQAPAPALAYINSVRLDKHGLLDLARQAITFPNARLVEAPRQTEARLLCHYVRFVFRVTLTSDEKREQVASVLMDAQAGWPADRRAILERVTLEERSEFEHLPPARPRWIEESHPLAPAALAGLFERALAALQEEMAGSVESLRGRLAHFLELDRARLEQYYDDLARDLERRLGRADDDRRAALQEKLEAVRRERELKLADAEARYRLRVEPALVTAQVIAQPKLTLDVHVENRTTTVRRTVVYDPLLFRVEPLMCDVCGRPGHSLHLCSGGHLAHSECLLEEQCVDCKRVHCRRCAGEMEACAVCGRPVCRKSLNRCPECGRGTCREHRELCHAADGQPARPAEVPAEPAKANGKPAKARARPAPPVERPPKQERPAPRPPAPRLPAPERVTASRIVVEVEWGQPEVRAYVLSSKNRGPAVRTWRLSARGVEVQCSCEKGLLCPGGGRVFRPGPVSSIEPWLREQIEALRQEYGVPARGVSYLCLMHGAPSQEPRLILRGKWKDEQLLEQARAGFDAYAAEQEELYSRPQRRRR